MSLTSARMSTLLDKLEKIKEQEVKEEVEEAVIKVGDKKALKVKKEE